jgi:3-hydroxyacyl-[acyl-carrier-protein] dehydratase
MNKKTDTPSTDLEFESHDIKRLLPHRYPFLMIDRLTEIRPGVSAVAWKKVSIEEPHFAGHFPSHPVMPGVLIVEALAQVGAILALREIERREEKLVLFSGIERARFRQPVVPGDTLVLEVTALRIGSRVQRMKGEAKVEGRVVAEAEIMSVVAERSGIQ